MHNYVSILCRKKFKINRFLRINSENVFFIYSDKGRKCIIQIVSILKSYHISKTVA